MPINKPFLKSLSNHLYDSIETADALGRSLIVQKDATLSVKAKKLPGKFIVGKEWMTFASAKWFVCDDNIVRLSFDLIPEDVLKVIKTQSIEIAGIEDGKLLEAVKEKLRKVVESGGDFKQFKNELSSVFDSYGVTAISNNHLQTIFRTNVFSSYSIAQLDQVRSMQDRFPKWRYVAIIDNRTRQSHKDLNGNIYNVGDGPIPPIDYNCRCTAQYLHVTQSYDETKYVSDYTANDNLVKLDIRESFLDWVKDNEGVLTDELKGWIQDNS